jgi:hypothetical protein
MVTTLKQIVGARPAADRRTMLRWGAASLTGLALPGFGASAARAAQSRRVHDGEQGVELLRTWAAGTLPKHRVPSGWEVYAPARGAAFYYPDDWTVDEITDPDIYDLYDGNPFGALVYDADETAGVLMLNVISNEPVSAVDAAWAQLEQFNEDRDLDELAEDEHRGSLNVTSAFVAARKDDTISAVFVQTTPDTVMGGTYLYVLLVAGLAEEFDKLAEDVFLPLLQNLVTDGGSACDTDPEDDDYTLDDCPSGSN